MRSGLRLDAEGAAEGGRPDYIGFEARLIEVTNAGARRLVASADGYSLDEAINEAVESLGADPRTGGISLRAHMQDNTSHDRCPCENEACEREGRHRVGECPNRADPALQVEYLGALCPACYEKMPEEYRKNEDDLEPNRRWSTKYKDSLPDSAFLYVRPNCVEHKDAQGRSHPLDCRDLPVKNRAGNYDYAHVKNAISRAVQLKGVPMSVQRKLQAKARAIFKREFGGAED
jgi:hypothetical protein